MKKLWPILIVAAILGFAEEGDLKWRFETGYDIRSSPAVSFDGTIYIGSGDGPLYAVTHLGELEWECAYVRLSSGSSLAIGWDGSIYYGGSYRGTRSFNALAPSGELKWSYEMEEWTRSSPAIAADGTIYFTVEDNQDDYYLYALTPQGELKWKYQFDIWTPALHLYSSPAIGLDGTIYLGAPDGYFYSFSPTGQLNWRYETDDPIECSPAIGSDGTIYFRSDDGNLYALTSTGELKWEYHFWSWLLPPSSPLVSSDGVIYFGEDYIYAFDLDGGLLWKREFGGNLQSYRTPAIGADGTLYVPALKDYFCAVTPSGDLKWKYDVESGFSTSSPAIATNGTIYVGGGRYLYAFESSSPGLALAPWPKFRHDNYNTGRYGWYNVSPVSIRVPQEGNIYHSMVPAACFKNVGLFDVSGFYCHAEIVSKSYYTLPYHVSVLVSDTLAPGDSVLVSFAEWVCDDNASYIATYYTTSEIDTPWVCMSMSVEFQGCAGIEEDGSQYLPSFEIVSLSNSQVVFRYSEFSQGFNVSVFDVLGRQIDDLYSASPSGIIIWGEGQASGVYFASVKRDYTTLPQRFVLIK